jgi:hypothetical protein
MRTSPLSPRLRTRWARVAAVAFCGCAAILPVGPVQAQEAVVPKDAWWNRFAGPQESTGLPALPLPPPSTVPADAIAVGALNGQVDKVAAVGLRIDVPAGMQIDELLLVLRLSDTPGANVAADEARVFACPATSLWGTATNGDWINRPSADCDAGFAYGEFGTDGSLVSFDLTRMGPLWLDPSTGFEQNGVVLALDAEQSAENAQLSFLNVESGRVDAFLVVSPAPTDPTPAPTPRPSQAPAFIEEFIPGTPARPATTSAPAPTPAPTPQPVAQRSTGIRPPDLWGGLPWTVFLLVPLAAVLAVGTGMALGPAGEPTGSRVRKGAVTRALERREDTRQ